MLGRKIVEREQRRVKFHLRQPLRPAHRAGLFSTDLPFSHFHWQGALPNIDLRHTWASWHVQNGTPLFALQELGGWASTEMVRRYAHLAPAQMAKHAEVVGNLLNATNTAQSQK